MSVPRSRKQEKLYTNYLSVKDDAVCDFCEVQPGHPQFVEATKYFKVIKNRFSYSLWDQQSVDDHMMIVPHTHTNSLAQMPDAQKIEFVNLIERYEQAGYNIYARAPVSVRKTVVHQHTHLIKPTGPTKRFVLSLRWPYIIIAR